MVPYQETEWLEWSEIRNRRKKISEIKVVWGAYCASPKGLEVFVTTLAFSVIKMGRSCRVWKKVTWSDLHLEKPSWSLGWEARWTTGEPFRWSLWRCKVIWTTVVGKRVRRRFQMYFEAVPKCSYISCGVRSNTPLMSFWPDAIDFDCRGNRRVVVSHVSIAHAFQGVKGYYHSPFIYFVS